MGQETETNRRSLLRRIGEMSLIGAGLTAIDPYSMANSRSAFDSTLVVDHHSATETARIALEEHSLSDLRTTRPFLEVTWSVSTVPEDAIEVAADRFDPSFFDAAEGIFLSPRDLGGIVRSGTLDDIEGVVLATHAGIETLSDDESMRFERLPIDAHASGHAHLLAGSGSSPPLSITQDEEDLRVSFGDVETALPPGGERTLTVESPVRCICGPPRRPEERVERLETELYLSYHGIRSIVVPTRGTLVPRTGQYATFVERLADLQRNLDGDVGDLGAGTGEFIANTRVRDVRDFDAYRMESVFSFGPGDR